MSLDLYIGPMFAGKSSSILGILRRNAFIGRTTLCLTSSLDRRYTSDARIVSHDQESYPAVAAGELIPILSLKAFADAVCVIVEEAQFFPDLRAFVLEAVEKYGKQVICVGLDGDSDRRPFGQLLDLIPYADTVTKFHALCSRCRDGTKGLFSYRKPGCVTDQINVGTNDQYEALCRKHYLAG